MPQQHETRARTVKIIVGICFAVIVFAYLPLAYYRIHSLFQSLGQSSAAAEYRAQQLFSGDVSEKLQAAATKTKEQWQVLQQYQAETQQVIQFTDEVQRAVSQRALSATSTPSDNLPQDGELPPQ